MVAIFSKMLTTLSYIRRADRVANSVKLQLSLPVEPWKLASTNTLVTFVLLYIEEPSPQRGLCAKVFRVAQYSFQHLYLDGSI